MYRSVLWTLWERERVGRFGRMALKHVYYHVWNESPVQVRCTILDAWGWCTGTTQREGMGREEGGGPSTGNMCTPAADPRRHMAKPIQHCKAKKQNKEKKKSIPRILFMVRTTMGLCFLWWTIDVMCPSHHIRGPVISMWYLTTGETEFDHLVKVGCLRFPYCNITLLPLSPLYSL